MGRLIQIVAHEETVEWHAKHPDTGELFDTWFTLRIVPLSVQRAIRAKYTKPDWHRGTRDDVTDGGKFVDDALDYAIVGWRGVESSKGALECVREYKLLQPEFVKAEVIRLCLGRELGQLLAGDVQLDEDQPAPFGTAVTQTD